MGIFRDFKDFIKGVLLFCKHRINRHPELKEHIMRVLKHFPVLEQRLRKLGRPPGQGNMEEQYEPVFNEVANRIYEELKRGRKR